MYRPGSSSSDSLRNDTDYNDIKRQRTRTEFNIIPLIGIAIIAFSLIFSLSIIFNEGISWNNNNYVYAQAPQQKDDLSSKNKVTIHLNSVKFAPLTYSDSNQLKILVDYQTKDPTLVNTHMDGVMKVYDSDGTLLKTSPIQKGFVLGESGVIQFATSFTDKTIKDVTAEVALTDALHEKKISNTLKTSASLE